MAHRGFWGLGPLKASIGPFLFSALSFFETTLRRGCLLPQQGLDLFLQTRQTRVACPRLDETKLPWGPEAAQRPSGSSNQKAPEIGLSYETWDLRHDPWLAPFFFFKSLLSCLAKIFPSRWEPTNRVKLSGVISMAGNFTFLPPPKKQQNKQ